MTKILVTGSAGFIGFHVAKAMLELGWLVIGIDDFNPYYAPELKRARNENLNQKSNFVAIEATLSDKQSLRRMFQEFSPELVCHLAAQPGVRYSLRNPYAYQRSNLEGFLNVIEEARFSGIRRFVYASSSSVYGGNTKMPYSEDDPVDTPVSLYAATKRSNELTAQVYSHIWGLQTIGLRFFTVYGPWGRPDMAYWSFLENIFHGEPISVYNYGKNQRDFTYVDDVVPGVIAALTSESLERAEIINLGNNRPVGLLEFIEKLEGLSGRTAIKEMVPAQPGDVVATYADINKAKNKLGFSPRTSIDEGLEKFVTWYLGHPELADSVRRFRRSEK